jgi:hypothetical protein
LRIHTGAPPKRESTVSLVEGAIESKPTEVEVGGLARRWNEIATLAILLEPVYWPRITGVQRHGGAVGFPEFNTRWEQYHAKACDLVARLSPQFWHKAHKELRDDAAWMDGNDNLYLLLRVSTWEERKKLTGTISGALWIRHLAEVIRRGFEEVHQTEWPEEDRAFVIWSKGGRKRVLGSERPLDDEFRSKVHLAYRFGLFTGSPVRWYVEGGTERFAVQEILSQPERYGVGLVNLRGAIKDGSRNIAMTLQDSLLEDRALRRFSVISFDLDEKENVKLIQRQVQEDNIVGMIAAHDPDFEFANFHVRELVDIAAQIDVESGFPGDNVREADWSGVTSGKAFEAKYRKVSARRPSGLKGEQWGRALARYARANPRRSDNGITRPLLSQVQAALHAWNSNYDVETEMFRFDPNTFERIPR